MALKPILASGVAVVSAAAVIAATPEVLRARTLEVAPVAQGADPAAIAPGEYDLPVLSMLGALNAFFGDYKGVDPMRGAVASSDPAHPNADGAGSGEVSRSLVAETHGVWSRPDDLALQIPAGNLVDGSLQAPSFVGEDGRVLPDAGEVFDQIIDDLGIGTWVGLIVKPVEVLAGAIGIHLNMRDGWRAVRTTVRTLLNLATLIPAQVVEVVRKSIDGLVRAIEAVLPVRGPKVAGTALRIDAQPTGAEAFAADAEKPTPGRQLDFDGGANAAPDSSDTTSKRIGRLRDAVAEPTTAIGSGLKDLKEKVKQARADRKAALEGSKEQRRLERRDRVRPFGGSETGTETTGGTGEGVDSSTGGDTAE
jgi:hypothetical protein